MILVPVLISLPSFLEVSKGFQRLPFSLRGCTRIVLGMLEKFSDKCCDTQSCDGNNEMSLPDTIAFIKNITTREHKEDRLI